MPRKRRISHPIAAAIHPPAQLNGAETNACTDRASDERARRTGEFVLRKPGLAAVRARDLRIEVGLTGAAANGL